MKRHDHKHCDGHFRHPAFSKRLCFTDGVTEADARSFADEIAAVIAASKVPAAAPLVVAA